MQVPHLDTPFRLQHFSSLVYPFRGSNAALREHGAVQADLGIHAMDDLWLLNLVVPACVVGSSASVGA